MSLTQRLAVPSANTGAAAAKSERATALESKTFFIISSPRYFSKIIVTPRYLILPTNKYSSNSKKSQEFYYIKIFKTK